ncbi:MAG TPA: ParB/RepB/Spo0J family partition protein [Thermoanaerobaculia bacterium]|nr:ParB/RepB/Spo0J family partition protein [Thermoanaerobaculia bacterium]
MQPPDVLTALVVPVDHLVPDPDQPRTEVDRAELDALATSIKAAGVIQPLLVSHHPDPAARASTPYMIIAGERRWRAACEAGLATVPVVVHPGDLSAPNRLMMQLDENDGELRRELSLYDRAVAVDRALSLSALRKDEFARRHHKSNAWVSHYVAIAGATGATREALAARLLTGIAVTRLFARLSASHQRRLLTHAKRTRLPITAARIESLAQRGADQPRAMAAAPGTADSQPGASTDLTASAPARAPVAGPRPAAAEAGRSAPATTAKISAARSVPRPAKFALAAEDLAALLRLLGHEPQGTAQDQFRQLISLARGQGAASPPAVPARP